MASQPFPLVSVEGTPFERGQQHGSQARERIAHAIETHRRGIRHYARLEWDAVVARGATYLPYLESYAPQMVEELHGIAEGAGRTFDDILALNLRYELTFTPAMVQACTAFAVLPGATADGHTYVGQTWDNLAPLVEACIVLKARRPNGTTYVTVAEAGVPAMVGLNSAGVGVVRNALVIAGDREPGVPMNAVHYRILAADILGDAVGAVLAPRLASPMNYLVGAAGDAICLEATPEDADFIHDQGGVITHTNHFVSTRLRVRDLGKVTSPHSLLRDRRMRRFLDERRGYIDVPTIFRGLQDHFNYPDSICRHPDERDAEAGRMATVFAVVMDMDERTLYLSDGPPCQHDYRKIEL